MKHSFVRNAPFQSCHHVEEVAHPVGNPSFFPFECVQQHVEAVARVSHDMIVQWLLSPPQSEVVRAGLRLLEDQETQMAALRSALIAGEESGPADLFDFDAFVAAKKS